MREREGNVYIYWGVRGEGMTVINTIKHELQSYKQNSSESCFIVLSKQHLYTDLNLIYVFIFPGFNITRQSPILIYFNKDSLVLNSVRGTVVSNENE